MAKNVPKIANVCIFCHFYVVEEVLSFDLVGHMWKLVKNWLQEWVFKIYKWKSGRSRWILYFDNYLQNSLELVWGMSHRISHNNFPQKFPATISRKIFLQEFPTIFSPQHFPSWILIGWLPITLFQMQNFHQSLPFLNWLFPLLHFPQDFPELDPDWLAPHHPIPSAKFPPITALLNRPTYHKRSKVSPPPFPQILWEPQINE